MKKTFYAIATTLLFSAIIFNGCKDNQKQSETGSADSTTIMTNRTDSMNAKTVYTCPMHPEIVSDTPGTCPKCGMDLEVKS